MISLYRINKNIISPISYILSFLRGNMPSKRISLGDITNQQVQRWVLATKKQHPIFRRFNAKTIAVALIDLSTYSCFDEYLTKVKGKNSPNYFANRCKKEGYYFSSIDFSGHSEEIYNINTSSLFRQGKKMKEKFFIRDYDYNIDEQTSCYGVFTREGVLVSYIHLLELNEVVIITELLGHANHLKDNIMYLMVLEAIQSVFKQRESKSSVKFLIYDSFFSNSDGLKLFKRRFKFIPHAIHWDYNK